MIVSDALVPEIWAFEIANNIFVSLDKRKRIDEHQAGVYLFLLKALPIPVELQPLWSNVDLESVARRWDAAAYDAAYLALGLRRGLPLATSDVYPRKKAADAGVAILGLR